MEGATSILDRFAFLFPLGIAAATAVVAVVLARRTGMRALDRCAGVVATGAALFGLSRTDTLGDAGTALLLAVVLLALGTALAMRAGTIRAVLAWNAPGAILLAFAAERGQAAPEYAILAALMLLVLVHPIASLDADWEGTGLGVVAVALAAGGVYACVPDTEQAIPVLGATLGIALIALVFGQLRLGAAGSGALLGTLLWAMVVGGTGRAGSVVGGAACVVCIAIEPLVHGRRALGPVGRAGALAVLAIDAVGVVLLSRVAGLQQGFVPALLIAVPVLVGVAGATTMIGARPSRTAPPSGRGPR